MASYFIYYGFQTDGVNGYAKFCIVRLRFVRELDKINKCYLEVPLITNQWYMHDDMRNISEWEWDFHIEPVQAFGYNVSEFTDHKIGDSYEW